MLVVDCTDCYTKVDFKQTIFTNSFDSIDSVLDDAKNISMFMVDDYLFEFNEYIKDDGELCLNKDVCTVTRWVVGRYITPIPHLVYMLEEETWFKISEQSSNKFTFFTDDEVVISMHGMLFYKGEFRENLIHRFNINEVRALSDDLCEYVIKKYKEEKTQFSIWNMYKCIGIYSEKE